MQHFRSHNGIKSSQKPAYRRQREWIFTRLLHCARHCFALWIFFSKDSRNWSPGRLVNLSKIPQKVNGCAEFQKPRSVWFQRARQFYYWMIVRIKWHSFLKKKLCTVVGIQQMLLSHTSVWGLGILKQEGEKVGWINYTFPLLLVFLNLYWEFLILRKIVWAQPLWLCSWAWTHAPG